MNIMKTPEWEYDKIYCDWLLRIELPTGNIKGTISFTNNKAHDYAAWGTVEVNTPDRSDLSCMRSKKYDNPTDAVDEISRNIMAVMAIMLNSAESN